MTALLELTTFDLAAGLLLALLGLIWLVHALSSRRQRPTFAPSAVSDPQELALTPEQTYLGPGQAAHALALLARDAAALPSPVDLDLLAVTLPSPAPHDPAALPTHALRRQALPPLLSAPLLAPDLRRLVLLLFSLIAFLVIFYRLLMINH